MFSFSYVPPRAEEFFDNQCKLGSELPYLDFISRTEGISFLWGASVRVGAVYVCRPWYLLPSGQAIVGGGKFQSWTVSCFPKGD